MAADLVQQSQCARHVSGADGQVFEFHDVVDFSAHGDVGHTLQHTFDHDGNLELGHPGFGLLHGRSEVLSLVNANGLATQTFNDLNMVNTVAMGGFFFICVDIVER